jgi:ferredoxin
MLALAVAGPWDVTKHLSYIRARCRFLAVKIVVDHERCQGHGRCYDLAPGIFDADDDGHVALLAPNGQVPADAEPQAVLAVKNCPERALSRER